MKELKVDNTKEHKRDNEKEHRAIMQEGMM